MTQFSTGLRNDLLTTGDFKTLMDSGQVKIYSGTVPANADVALPGDATLMYTLTVDDDGSTLLTFDNTPIDGVIQKTASESWEGLAAAAGDMSYYRYFVPADTGATASTTAKRIQGTVGTAFADLIVENVTKALNDPLVLDYFAVAIPVSSP